VKASAQPVQPSRKEFLALAQEHTLVPVCRHANCRPGNAGFGLSARRLGREECFMLESVENGEQVGRYTFIAWLRSADCLAGAQDHHHRRQKDRPDRG